MKTIKNELKSVEFTNRFGEKMVVAQDRDLNIWFKHEDCGNKFENVKDMNETYEVAGKTYSGFKYVLDKPERDVLINFISECEKELI